jgi:PEP-CTERM motif-containing protein
MKKLFVALAVIGFAVVALGQGYVTLDNVENTDPSPTATANGLVFVCANNHFVPVNQDFNFAVYGGTDSANLSLLQSISGAAAAGDNILGPGTFIDLSGNAYVVPGSSTQSNAFFRVQGWLGPYSSYNAALFGGGLVGQSSIFVNPVGVLPYPPADLVGMPAFYIGPLECPEPGTLGLAGMGLVLGWVVFRRQRQT